MKYMKSWERERELLEIGKAEGGDLRDAQRIEDMVRRGKTAEEIIDFCGYPDELVKKIEAQKHINA